ncbi:MAG: ABC transporter ATP-binding protein [Candidatus Roizmanbacteria bacterium]|nr:ABC transporter ATP-binding protein [Candidatus Roizmanbacteria bacterium]
MKPIIEIKNIGKKYNITHQRGGYIALRDILTNILKNPFKFAKHKAKQAVGLVKKEEFWALQDINLDIHKGEIIGIIGANGAGKSTLLKILTGITPPAEGEVIMRGKVASLLEVGTGFHPELTGRENIFLNGAILGMTKKEIARKFDEIVAFSGIEKFLDTPVKYYSSGMYVRLAFSVAAHMEPDILLVDEVLAVGDAEFQKKCLGKMEEVTQEKGRTILFVSHNMAAIQRLCQKTILLENGKLKKVGETEQVIKYYLDRISKIEDNNIQLDKDFTGDGGVICTKISLLNDSNKIGLPREGGAYSLELEWKKVKKITLSDLQCGFAIHNSQGILVTRLSSSSIGKQLEANNETGKWTCSVDKNLLPRGEYYSNIRIDSQQGMEYWKINAFSFRVNPGSFQNDAEPKFHGQIFHQPQNWING